MSYTPGTRLVSSNNSENAVVLSDGMVMANACENGWRWRQMMKLDDWLLMSGGVKVIEAASPKQQEDAPAPAAAPAPLPKRPDGTKLRWVLGEETYRIAIATANGILQVKSVTDGEGDCLPNEGINSWGRARLKKTMFTTEEEWRASLPQGGQVTIVDVQQQQALPVVEGTSDIEKVEKLAIRFKVRAGVHENSPPVAQRITLLDTINRYTKFIADSEAKASRTEYEVHACESYKRALNLYKVSVQKIDAMTEVEKNRQSFNISRWAQGKQKLTVTLANGISTQISPSSSIQKAGKGGNPIPRGIFCHHDRKLYSSLAEMNPFKGSTGLPVIHAHYRTKIIDLSHLFAPQAVMSSSTAYDSGC